MSAEKNIPGIKSIEFVDKNSVTFSTLLSKHPLVDFDQMVEGLITELEFLSGSASLQELLKTHNAGDYFEISLPFRIARITPEITALLDSLRTGDLIYRAVDQQDQGYVIGGPNQRVRFEYQKNISADPTGSRGYNCKISFQTDKGLIYCI